MEADKKQVGGCPSESEIDTRERKISVENDSRMKNVKRDATKGSKHTQPLSSVSCLKETLDTFPLPVRFELF